MGDGDLMLIARGRLWGLASAILLTSLITDATRVMPARCGQIIHKVGFRYVHEGYYLHCIRSTLGFPALESQSWISDGLIWFELARMLSISFLRSIISLTALYCSHVAVALERSTQKGSKTVISPTHYPSNEGRPPQPHAGCL